jgi:hypothetical protein
MAPFDAFEQLLQRGPLQSNYTGILTRSRQHAITGIAKCREWIEDAHGGKPRLDVTNTLCRVDARSPLRGAADLASLDRLEERAIQAGAANGAFRAAPTSWAYGVPGAVYS